MRITIEVDDDAFPKVSGNSAGKAIYDFAKGDIASLLKVANWIEIKGAFGAYRQGVDHV